MIGLNHYLGLPITYGKPHGEAGFCGPDSVSWRVFLNPVTLAIGGISAVLMEFADPRIRSAVWEHSDFKADPAGRAQRTATAALIGVYGPKSLAIEIIQRVSRMHTRIQGTTPEGHPYRADDPDLLAWVGATATYGFVTAHECFCGALSEAERNQFFMESTTIAALYGVPKPIASQKDFDDLLQNRQSHFTAHPIISEFLDIMYAGKAAPWAPMHLQRPLVRAAVSLLPPPIHSILNIDDRFSLSALDRAAIRSIAAVLNRVPNPNHPAAKASRRYGLSWNFCWMGQHRQAQMLRARH